MAHVHNKFTDRKRDMQKERAIMRVYGKKMLARYVIFYSVIVIGLCQAF